jgi:hypothetical protein
MRATNDRPEFSSATSRRVVRLVAVGQMGFAAGIALCVALRPHLVLHADEGGISNFGVHLETVVPYTVALGLPALLTFRASRHIAPSSPRLRTLLGGYSVLILFTLLTTYTYKIDEPLKIIHVGVGALLTIFEMGSSWWMCRQTRALYGVLTLEFVGFVLAALTIVGVLHLLFVTQLMVGAPFALILIRTCGALASSTASSDESD